MTKPSTLRLFTAIAFMLIGFGNLQASETATATISGTPSGAVFNYDITLTDTGTTPIGTFWFAWVPGQGFLPALPTNVTGPAGWASAITDGPLPNDGYSIRWIAGAGDAINPGDSLSGFDFTSTLSPADLAGISTIHPGTPILTSFIYSGGPFSDAGVEFQVSEAVHTPEPATLSLIGIACAGLGLIRRKRLA